MAEAADERQHDGGASKVLGEKGKRKPTDRSDAEPLARLRRSWYLRGIYVPNASDEAIRGLRRARVNLVDDLRQARRG